RMRHRWRSTAPGATSRSVASGKTVARSPPCSSSPSTLEDSGADGPGSAPGGDCDPCHTLVTLITSSDRAGSDLRSADARTGVVSEGAAVAGEVFKNRFTFVAAAIGMAVGTGNLWRFPRVVGE